MTETEIEQLIKSGINDANVFVKDTTGGGDHFSAIVISDEFEGKNLIEQHKMVYKTLGNFLTNQVHALQLKTYTYNRWKSEQTSQ
tara:strand:+ start:943 stop:1197 length:255 start_codon:yes stop_codon:yes gene_type:complete